MPVSTESTVAGPFIPNGSTTQFAFAFKGASADEVAVVNQNGAALSTALYSVDLDDDEGGTVVFSVAPTLADYAALYIIGDPTLTQPADFDNAGPSFNPAALTRALDRAALRDLKLQGEIDRAFKLPFDATTVAGLFPVVLPGGDMGFASGTGADDGLRADLADSLGAALVGGVGVVVFATVATAAAASIAVSINYVRTLSYAIAADNGGTEYKRSATEPTHPGKFQDALGAWWEIAPIDGVGKVESFGAKASNDVADATTNRTALQNAHIAWKAGAFREIDYKRDGRYHVGAWSGAQSSLFGATHLSGAKGRINGNGATLVYTSDKVNSHDIYLFDRFNGVFIDRLFFEDTSGAPTAGSNPQGVRCITAIGGFATSARGLTIKDCGFTGAFACVSVLTNDPAAAGRVSGVRVENCTGTDCYYGVNCQEDGDGSSGTMTFFNVRRALFVYGVSDHDWDMRVSHDGVFQGSTGMFKVTRYVRNTYNIKVRGAFSGSVAQFIPCAIDHINDDGNASIVDGVDFDLSFGNISGGNTFPGFVVRNYSAAGVEQLTALAPGGDADSPVTTYQRTRNLRIRFAVSTWGAEPFVKAYSVPYDPGNVVLDVPNAFDERAIQMEGFQVNGAFEYTYVGSIASRKVSIPLRHVLDKKVSVEMEVFAVQNTDGTSTDTKIYNKRLVSHGRIESDGDTASIGALATVNDLSTGSPDLATAEDWTLGSRYRLTLSSASHYTGSGALVRVRARVRTALSLP